MKATVTKVKIIDLIGPALNWAYYEVYFKKLMVKGESVKQWVLEQHYAAENDADRTDCEITFYQIISAERIGVKPMDDSTNLWAACKDSVSVTGTGAIQAVLRLYIMNHYNLTNPEQTILVPEKLI